MAFYFIHTLKRYIIPLVAFLIIAGVFFAYYTWDNNRGINSWEIVPKDAVLVYEAHDIIGVWQSLDSIKTWKALRQLPAVEKLSKDVAYIDSLAGAMNGGKSELSVLFDGNPLLVSLFVTAAHDFDFLYTLEIKTLEQHAIVSQLVESITSSSKKTTRNYLGKTLSEIAVGNRQFTYIYHKSFFIGSFTPFLVEDAIRTINEGSKSGFVTGKEELFRLAKLTKDHGNIYLNASQLGRLVEVFTDRVNINLSVLNQLASMGFLDLRLDPNAIVLNGFTFSGGDGTNLLSAFSGNVGVPFSLQSLVPNSASHIFHFSFQDFAMWQQKWLNLPHNTSKNINSLRQTTVKEYDLDVSAYNRWIGREVALVNLEVSTASQDKLIAIATPDIGEALAQLNTTAERLAKLSGDTIFIETYADRQIREIKLNELPMMLFGEPFGGFESTFYLPIDGNIVLSNSIRGLKILIDDLENENTWGKSVRMLSYLESLNKESNLSLIVNTSRSWSQLLKVLDAEWKVLFEESNEVFRGFDMIAAQFSNIDDKYYTNIVLSHTGAVSSARKQQYLLPEKTISLPSTIVTRPFFGRNPANRTLELTLQDEDGQFYHISNDFQVIWSDSLPGKIVSEVLQFDYYKNNKLQFLFATEKQIFGIDRTGEQLPGYPISNPSSDAITHLALLDYDKSKNYRVALADVKGKVWLLDKTGAQLEGWSPKDFGGRLLAPPTHLRVAGKDMILVGLVNGLVHLVNRKGENYAGFPLELKGSSSNPFIVEVGSTFEKTRFTTITDGGEIVQFLANGKVTQREQLIKSGASSKFQLVPDVLSKGFVISKTDDIRVSILDAKGKELFAKDYIDSENLIFQYYNFGAGNEVVVITDQQQSFSYLFDKKGTLINFQPIASDHAIGIMYTEATSEYKVYKAYLNEVAMLSVKR